MPKPTVFISYRRQPSIDLARYIHDKIAAWGIDVFLDLEGLSGGDKFPAKIQKEIINRDVFLIILAPETLQSEWVVRELKIALEQDKKIIPLVTNDFDFYRNVPDSISKLGEYNAIKYDPKHPEIAFGEIKNALGVGKAISILPIVGIVIVLVVVIAIAVVILNSQQGIAQSAATSTETPTASPTDTETPTATDEPTDTPTNTEIPTDMPTDTATATDTPSSTPSNTISPTDIPSHTVTNTTTDTDKPSNTPTATPSEKPTSTLVVTLTFTSVPVGFPCDGTIKFYTGGLVYEVRASPLRAAPTRPPVEQGDDVIVIDSTRSDQLLWYQIEYSESDSGFIPAQYLELSENCPEE